MVLWLGFVAAYPVTCDPGRAVDLAYLTRNDENSRVCDRTRDLYSVVSVGF